MSEKAHDGDEPEDLEADGYVQMLSVTSSRLTFVECKGTMMGMRLQKTAAETWSTRHMRTPYLHERFRPRLRRAWRWWRE